MAVAARQKDAKRQTSRDVGLVVVSGGRRRNPMNAATVRNLTFVVCAVMVVFMLAGLSRVWMSSQATQASLESQQLKFSLKEASKKGDTLEVEYAFNARTERIQVIARDSLAMIPAQDVSYIDLSPPAPAVVAEVPDSAFANKTVRADATGLADLIAGLLSGSESGVRVVGGR